MSVEQGQSNLYIFCCHQGDYMSLSPDQYGLMLELDDDFHEVGRVWIEYDDLPDIIKYLQEVYSQRG